MTVTLDHFDVLIVGAGLSGIGAGYHLQTQCPGLTYAILESRSTSGGTWDLFRYPGVRSDSDMHTLGYAFRPWQDSRSLADGASILDYINNTAIEHRIDQHIRFHHRVLRAAWSTADARWTLDVERRTDDDAPSQTIQLTCNFLLMCSGYYRYDGGYTPEFRGRERFTGRIVHPQQWSNDIDYRGKRVVVIGSGATAVTMVPAMARDAAHVTMLQRSPSYIVSLPGDDRMANVLRRLLPEKLAYRITRWKNVALSMLFFSLSRRSPDRARGIVLSGVKKQLGNDVNIAAHFTPRYNPWDQRVCFAPDGDLFKAIRSGRASVVTGQIDTFTERGIRLQSGDELPADVIVTATGLNLVMLGDVSLSVDGKPIDIAKTLNYQGMMFSDVPNLASVFGYTNAAWTLKADLTCGYVCRLINHMKRSGMRQCTPRNRHPASIGQARLDFSPGYVRRSLGIFPRQGARSPWKVRQNYLRDYLAIRFGSIRHSVIEFSNPASGERRQR